MGRILLSICAVVVAMVLGGSAQPVHAQQQASAAGQPAKAAQKAREQRLPIFVTLSSADGRGQAYHPKSHDHEKLSGPSPWFDLWAQGLMALWAFLQLILTGIGIWFIRKTLIETETAVVEAGKATKAAQDAVEETRRIGEAQVRAYLHVKPEGEVIVTQPVFTSFGGIIVANSGQSPAFNARVEAVFMAEDHTRLDNSHVTHGCLSRRETIPAAGEATINFFWDSVGPDVVSAMVAETNQMHLQGHIKWEDVFGKTQSIPFHLTGASDPDHRMRVAFQRVTHGDEKA